MASLLVGVVFLNVAASILKTNLLLCEFITSTNVL